MFVGSRLQSNPRIQFGADFTIAQNISRADAEPLVITAGSDSQNLDDFLESAFSLEDTFTGPGAFIRESGDNNTDRVEIGVKDKGRQYELAADYFRTDALGKEQKFRPLSWKGQWDHARTLTLRVGKQNPDLSLGDIQSKINQWAWEVAEASKRFNP